MGCGSCRPEVKNILEKERSGEVLASDHAVKVVKALSMEVV
jgi:NAD(P)H-nitrite reductase large subunit